MVWNSSVLAICYCYWLFVIVIGYLLLLLAICYCYWLFVIVIGYLVRAVKIDASQ